MIHQDLASPRSGKSPHRRPGSVAPGDWWSIWQWTIPYKWRFKLGISSKTGELSIAKFDSGIIRIPCPQESILQTTIEPVGGQHLIWDWHAELGCCWRNPLQLYGICLPLMFLGLLHELDFVDKIP
jgi:hypothetical protein